MKKILLSAVATILMAGTAMAEGYQINSLSTKQIGMGHTGVALKLGAENMYFNPAGMAYMDKTLDLTGSFTGIMPTATATVDGKEYETDNGVSTPISVNAAFSIYPNLKGGIAFYTPYGSSINWTDNWPGSVLNQNVSLKAFTIQPTLAWAINDKFSIGLGAMVTWATVDLNKGLVSASTADNVINAMKSLGQLPTAVGSFGSTTPASVNLNGKTRIAVGFNIGAMYNVNDRLTFGASFRSKMDMKVKAGEAHVSYANELAQTLTGETIDLINRKCHDLKHQVAALRSCVPADQRERYLTELDRCVRIYDASLKTGSEVLDTVLTEKSLYCEAHQITLTCIADGAQLSFLDPVDVYTIFGNALDNAIEGVSRVEDTEKRVASVSVTARSGLVIFQFENYYEGELAFRGGLPQTTKEQDGGHGLGLRSIQYTVEKYGGYMTIHPEGNVFLLRVSIPIPE